MADRYDLAIGDLVTLRVNRLGLDSYRIVGLVFQPYLYFGGNQGEAAFYAAYDDAQQIIGFTGYSSIYVRFENFSIARQEAGNVRKTLTNSSPYKIVFYLLDNPDQNAFIVGVRQLDRVLVILAVVAIIVAGFLVTNVVSTIVAEQRQQMGAMKAMGATRFDIIIIYLLMAFGYGVIGTLPGLLLGIPLGQRAAEAVAPLANTILEDTTPPLRAVGLGLGLGLGIPILAALLPVLNASHVTIIEAMTDIGINAVYGKGLFPRLIKKLHLPATAHQALNQIVHRKARLALTILTLTLAVSAFMGMFAVFYTLNSVIHDVRDRLNYKAILDPTHLEMQDLMQSLLISDPVRQIQPGVAIELRLNWPDPAVTDGSAAETADEENNRLFVTGIDTQTALDNLVIIEGSDWKDDPNRPGVVLTPKLAERFEKQVGDTIHLETPTHAGEFEVIGIAEYPLETAFMEWQHLAAFVGEIKDAPTPNAYWEKVRLKTENGDAVLDDQMIWAIGIDERVGDYLVPGYDPAAPGLIISEDLAAAAGLVAGEMLIVEKADTSTLDAITASTEGTYPIINVVQASASERNLLLRFAPEEVQHNPDLLIVALYWSDLATLMNFDYRQITPRTFSFNLANPTDPDYYFARPVAVYNNELSFADRIAQTIVGLGMLMTFASLLMALVGTIGLLTITLISVFERQREIGVMRSVGATSRQIFGQFLLEGLLIGLIAWLIGLPVSYFLSRLLIENVPFSEVIRFQFPALTVILGFVGVMFLTAAATLYPSLVAARRTVSDILRYQ